MLYKITWLLQLFMLLETHVFSSHSNVMKRNAKQASLSISKSLFSKENNVHNMSNSEDEVSGAYEFAESPSIRRSDTQMTFHAAVEKVQELHTPENDGSPPGTNTQNEFNSLKTKAAALDQTRADSLKAGITGAANGVVKVIKGITSSNWIEIVQGSLDLIGSIAGMLGPMGTMVSTLLSVFSSIFGLFGGPTGKKETQEEMMERVVKAALEEARHDELKAEIMGAKDQFNTISDTINIFREQGDLTSDQALSFYEISLEGIQIFGILEHYINKWCAIGNVDDDNEDEAKTNTKYCLGICNLYADLSIYRQILLTDMASILAKANLGSTSDVFIKLIKKEKKKDAKMFRFFLDPLHFRKHRFVVASYYSQIQNYATLTMYLKEITYADITHDEKAVLNRYIGNPYDGTNFQNAKKLLHKTKAMLLICSRNGLQGKCYQISFAERMMQRRGSYSATRGHLEKESVYLSCGFTMHAIFEGKFVKYYGPSVYNINEELQKQTYYFRASMETANDRTRFCESENMAMDGPCISLEPRDYKVKELRSYGFNDNIKSLYVPSGTKVEAFEHRLTDNTSFAGRFYGPATYMKVYKPNLWSSLKISTSSVTTSNMLKLCAETDLNGPCIYWPIIYDTWITTDPMLKQFYYPLRRVKSMKIQASHKVTIKGEDEYKDAAYYYGPTTVTETEVENFSLKVEKINQ